MVEALERSPHIPALALSILPEGERRQVIDLFNAAQTPYPKDKLIHELFEEQVEHIPEALAVVSPSKSLTYAQLNAQANQLARFLRQLGVGPDQRVAVCVERSVEMIIGLLGILKAGGAYVPMDPSYPAERLGFMLTNSAPRVLLTQEALRERLPKTDIEVVALDVDRADIAQQDTFNIDARRYGLRPDHLAYVIYTSGSTGTPKGVMIEHRNVVNLMTWHCAAFGVRSGTRCSCLAGVGFDAAAWEIWPMLGVGATLLLGPPVGGNDIEALLSWWTQQVLDVSFMPTPMAELTFTQNIRNPHLSTLLVGGDSLRYLPTSGSFTLVNNYGPTESAVVATSGPLSTRKPPAKSVHSAASGPTPADGSLGDFGQRAASADVDNAGPDIHIGRPIDNIQVYILNASLQPVPVGVAGEIFIAGAGLARGYLDRPDLTADRFIAVPPWLASHGRLYRTGDLARWREDGTVEFLGRNDGQVKIRGFRVELGEIETQLMQHPQVREAAVLVRQESSVGKRLVAYVTLRVDGDLSADQLRAHLRDTLPDYMIPSAFITIDRMPLTANGKLDRGALPVPQPDAFVSREYEVPQGEIENVIAGVWQDLLHVEQVGRQDDFFELGGHSLLALNAVFKINALCGSKLSVADIYRHHDLRGLAERVRGKEAVEELVELAREAVLDQAIRVIPGLETAPDGGIMLTGCTGFVGRFLLAELLAKTAATIYCLVRAPSVQVALTRVRNTLVNWNLWKDEFEKRIVVIPSDVSLPRMGLDERDYRRVCREVGVIYHCATSMNHLETYTKAKAANVDGVCELLKIAVDSRIKIFNYISTTSVFSLNGFGTTRVVDETSSIDRERHRSVDGYAASKWVGEKLVMIASDRGIPCNIFRLGLVWSDTQEGRYDEMQREYRLFKSCLLSGYGIRHYGYDVDPTPVDYVARAVVFLADRHRGGRGIFHVVSSSQKSKDLFERCNEIAHTSLKLLSPYDWVCEIKRLHHAGWSLPVAPLIEFAFSMSEAQLNEYLRVEANAIRFDSRRTQGELERAGIVAPELDDQLIKLCIANLLERDPEFVAHVPETSATMMRAAEIEQEVAR
jgi:thioester reductase-like protein